MQAETLLGPRGFGSDGFDVDATGAAFGWPRLTSELMWQVPDAEEAQDGA
jgi:hypothetical protein